ncbi:MAG TPA: glycosyltransferase family 39 protein, partial [Tepidisphaeraceae bacterium]|nr:glycosyltransferase family 39 protein [Tepidisphaeraceae bacterium]
SYLLQGRMLLDGRLFAPSPVSPEHFEHFAVLASPKYGSAYFPGLAPPLALAMAMNLPGWVVPLLAASLSAGLIFVIIRRLFGPVEAIIAFLLVMMLPLFRGNALNVFSSVLAMMQTTLAVYLVLRWRERASMMLAGCAGAVMGWFAITRPTDAAGVGVVLLVAVLGSRHLPRVRCTHLLVAGCLAMPFVLWQLSINRAVSGRWLTTPFSLYAAHVHPGAEYGRFGAPDDLKPTSTLPQVQHSYELDTRPVLELHRPGRIAEKWVGRVLPGLSEDLLASRWLLVLVPPALLAMNASRAIVIGTGVMAVAMYLPYAFYMPHYSLVALLGMIALVFTGIAGIARAWPNAKTPVLAAVTALGLFQLPAMLRADGDDEWVGRDIYPIVDRALATIPAPALVLFTAGTIGDRFAMVALNHEVSDIESAPIIRAHDRSDAANQRLFRAWRESHGQRRVYRYDVEHHTLTYLGRLNELADREPAAAMRAGGGIR